MAEKSSSSPGDLGISLPEEKQGEKQGEKVGEKPRLSDSEKKQNHIASEQKRRQAIRDGFDRLCELVPGLHGQGRSEGVVLKRTTEYIREQLELRRRLVQEKEARGEIVDERLKEPIKILEELEEKEKQKKARDDHDDDDDDEKT